MRRDTDEYRALRAARAALASPAEQAAADHARAAVDLARQRVDTVRRQLMRRQAGAADVATAEHQLSQALDHLEENSGW